MPHQRDEAALLLADERPPVLLGAALDVADDVKAPRPRVAGLEPQLRERHAQFGHPAVLVDRHGRVPHAVPRVVVPRVVEQRRVTLCAGGGHGEVRTGQVIVVRVERDVDGVGDAIGIAIPSGEPPGDGRGLAVEHPRADVDGLRRRRGCGRRCAPWPVVPRRGLAERTRWPRLPIASRLRRGAHRSRCVTRRARPTATGARGLARVAPAPR